MREQPTAGVCWVAGCLFKPLAYGVSGLWGKDLKDFVNLCVKRGCALGDLDYGALRAYWWGRVGFAIARSVSWAIKSRMQAAWAVRVVGAAPVRDQPGGCAHLPNYEQLVGKGGVLRLRVG